ncbi:MAG: YcaO-like family protein [Spirochaetales bacterium]|nr:YcaO-like family protein [Spirochaetales bacterium]
MKVVEYDSVSLHDELNVLENFINYKYGVIKNCRDIEKSYEDPDFFLSMASPCKPWNTNLLPGEYLLGDGNAVSIDKTEATLSAIGECLERYSSVFYNKNLLTFGSYNELYEKDHILFVNPDVFALYSREQNIKDMDFFTKDLKIYWTAGISLLDRKIKMVPAQLVYMPYSPSINEGNIYPANSTGLAFGRSLAETIYSGLCETVERDAFGIYWLNKLEFPRIKFPFGIDEIDSWYKRLFGDFDNEINVFDITSDIGFPTFFSLLKGRKEFEEPFISVGASANIDPIKAIKKAILESFHTRKYGIGLMVIDRTGHSKVFGDSMDAIRGNTFHQHVLRYTTSIIDLEEISFCYSPKKEIALDEIMKKHVVTGTDTVSLLKQGLKKLKSCKYDIVAVDVTSEDIAEAGFYSIKTMAPGLHPLWAGEIIPLGGKRIYEVPPRLGFKKKKIEEMNTYIHPFP